ncbi:MAG: hypothetical protein GX107_07455 [Clostridiales bacterium]|jgi:K+-sensing histidine kinase KdpD|nr:hypothetical protein [Clostridiales bacterium]
MNKKNVVLVCVTPQLSCERLIYAGNLIAKREGASVRILSVFPKRQCYNPDKKALDFLNRVAADINAAMTVCFSDEPVKSVLQYAAEQGVIKVVTGFPRSEGSSFITDFHNQMPGMPLCMVDDDSTAYQISPARGTTLKNPQKRARSPILDI